MIRVPGALSQRSQRFKFARLWVELSGILEILDTSPRPEGGRGRPAVHPPYNARGLLICLMELGLSRAPLTYAAMQEALFFTYSDAEMEMLGMATLRQHANYALFSSGLIFEHDDEDDTDVTVSYASTRARRAWASENERLRRAFERALVPIDDNVMCRAESDDITGNSRRYKNSVIDAERRRQGVLPQTAVRDEAMNRIILGSVYALNAQAYPDLDPTNVHAGILADHVHDYAIDETEYVTAQSATTSVKPDKFHARAELAAPSPKSRLYIWSEKIGLTILCTVSRPNRPRVPTLTVAGALGKPKPANPASVKTILEFLTSSGVRTKPRGRAHQFLVGDMAYPDSRGYAELMSKMRFSQVMKYPTRRKRIHPLRTSEAAILAEKQMKSLKAFPVAAHLANGCVVCPGVAKAALEGLSPGVPTPSEGTERILAATDLGMPQYRPAELQQHAEDSAWIEPFEMTSHGRAEIGPLLGPGRPRNDAPDAPVVHRQTFKCPAVDEKVRCPHVPESMDNHDLPRVPSPPPADDLPPTCRQTYTTLVFSRKEFKQLQPLRAGTWEHSDMYESARARNEAFNSVLKSPTGAGLHPRRIEATKNAFLTIAIAITVGTANHHNMTSWTNEVLANDGVTPREPHEKKQASRRRQLAAAKQKMAAA